MPNASSLRALAIASTLLASACSPPPLADPFQPGLANDGSTIVFISTRHDPAGDLHQASQIYLMRGDGTDVRQLTQTAHSNHFPALSPDGSRIVFDSYRLRREGEPVNTSDLFIMSSDGSRQTPLVRGSSGTWSPDGGQIAYQASASGKGLPTKPYPGPATTDSDIFVVSVSGLVGTGPPRNLTNSPDVVDEDPDWSPGGRQILFVRHPAADEGVDSETAEIYLMNADGAGVPTRLTNNGEEERAPSWSPDGRRIVFVCRRAGADLEICLMNADGTEQMQLTHNAMGDLTPAWSPDGLKIIFHRSIGRGGAGFELWTINADGTGEAQLTNTAGQNAFADWSRTKAIPAD